MSSNATGERPARRLFEAARGLGPTIGAMRNEIERERRLPAPLVEALRDAGLFSLWLAHAHGGPELSLTDFVHVIEALARADGSVAWCVSNAAGYSRFSGYLPDAVTRRIFVDERAVVAGNLGPVGTARQVPGGYQVTGRWAYGSGVTHSSWVLGGCVVVDADRPRTGQNGTPDVRVVFFPTAEAEVIDTWNVGGLRGTGSHDYEVTNLFVPESHATAGTDPLHPGPLYALPRHTAFGPAIAAVPLGIARAALDAVKEMSAGKTPRIGTAVLRDRPVVQTAIGRAEAQLRGARAFPFAACEEAWNAAASDLPLTLEQRVDVRMACAQVAEATKAVVQTAYDLGGGTSVYETCPIQRCFRDVHAAAQHIQVYGSNFETVGRVMLGLDPGTPIL